jgi:hypothetical protein
MKNQNRNDSLQSLIIDSAAENRKRIAKALSAVIRIDTFRTGHAILDGCLAPANNKLRMPSYLRGLRSIELIDEIDPSRVGATRLHEAYGIRPGTIGPTLREHDGERLISQDSDKKYTVSDSQVQKSCACIGAGAEA